MATSQTNTPTPATQPAAPSVPNSDKIHWASPPQPLPGKTLEAQYEVAKARNWISERLIGQSQRHWHCTRDQAIERLLAQHS